MACTVLGCASRAGVLSENNANVSFHRMLYWEAGSLLVLAVLVVVGLATLPMPNLTTRHLAPLSQSLSAASPSYHLHSRPPRAAASAEEISLVRQLYTTGHSRPHPELCPSLGVHLHLLVLVTSAPNHTKARDAVRLTWGYYGVRRDVALAFVLGTPPPHLEASLAAEDALYGDLIIGNSIDSYSNLTLKTLSILEWTATYCPRAPRLLKTDDDMFINVPLLLSFASAASRVNATRTIWGRLEGKSVPKRSTKSKYYVSKREWAASLYPVYVTGPAYLLTTDCVPLLLSAAWSERYLHLEDVFVTGVLADKLDIKRVHAPEFYNRKIAPKPCTIQRTIAAHMVEYHEQFNFWLKLLDGKSRCAS